MTTPTQIAEWREAALKHYIRTPIDPDNLGHSSYYVDGYIRASTEQAAEIAELKAKLAEVMPLAKFGAMVLRSQEFETELAVKCGYLVPNLKAGGYLYTIDQATIERILKD